MLTRHPPFQHVSLSSFLIYQWVRCSQPVSLGPMFLTTWRGLSPCFSYITDGLEG